MQKIEKRHGPRQSLRRRYFRVVNYFVGFDKEYVVVFGKKGPKDATGKNKWSLQKLHKLIMIVLLIEDGLGNFETEEMFRAKSSSET